LATATSAAPRADPLPNAAKATNAARLATKALKKIIECPGVRILLDD
jgi:hypothetical protein